jgi:hypothetical protein
MFVSIPRAFADSRDHSNLKIGVLSPRHQVTSTALLVSSWPGCCVPGAGLIQIQWRPIPASMSSTADIVSHCRGRTGNARRTSAPDGKQEPSRAELHSDNPAVRDLLDHMAKELAEEYIGLKKGTAAKPEERRD